MALSQGILYCTLYGVNVQHVDTATNVNDANLCKPSALLYTVDESLDLTLEKAPFLIHEIHLERCQLTFPKNSGGAFKNDSTYPVSKLF